MLREEKEKSRTKSSLSPFLSVSYGMGENGNEKKNRTSRLFILSLLVFFIHIALFGLFDTDIFPGFSFSLILFAVSFIVFSLLLYLIQKKYFFKLSILFSKKVLLSILFLYILMLVIASMNTFYSISKLKKDNAFKNSFSTIELDYSYTNLLTLRDVIIAQSSIDYKLDKELAEKIDFLKQFNISIELHFKKVEEDKEFLIMVALYPNFIYRESTKVFFFIVLYLYLFVIYWLLFKYLDNNARVKHAISVFVLIFPIYFVFFAFSGAFQNSAFPIVIESNKKSIMRVIIDEINENKEWGKNMNYIQGHSSSPVGINNIYVEIKLRSKR